MKKIFISAGELSGDILGAGLIQALKVIYPDAQFSGIAGPNMRAAGCEMIHSIDDLSAMGLFEVIPKLPKILSIRRNIFNRLVTNPPDIYIGIDAPDFNLPLEGKLKKRGIKTVHYVSPSVWAWRSGRLKAIKENTDLVLSLFPFEANFIKSHHVPVCYVGHRSADTLPDLYTRASAREILSIPEDVQLITLLPGSRGMEIKRMMPLFLETTLECAKTYPAIKCLIAAPNDRIAAQIQHIVDQQQYPFAIELVVDKTYAAIKAADVALVTSGTVVLETFLLDTPMVVAYKMNTLTWWIVRKLIKIKYCGLPNLLADREIVPEFVQERATSSALSAALLNWLQNPAAVAALKNEYQKILVQIRCGADKKAAAAIAHLLDD